MNLEALAALTANVGALGANDQKFAADLIAQHGNPKKKPLSDKQWHWVGVLADRATTPKAAAEAVTVGRSFAGVLGLFATASASGLKRPRIKLALPSMAPVALSLASSTSKNPGCVYVKVDGEYAGKVTPQGEFFCVKDAAPHKAALTDLLGALAADPAAVAAAYGKLTGACCFCSIKLTDPNSALVGYGPICADHYGLPHGAAHTATLELAETFA